MKKIQSFLVLFLLAGTIFTTHAQNLNILGMENYLNTTVVGDCNCRGQMRIPTTAIETISTPIIPSGNLWVGPSTHLFTPVQQQQLADIARQYANQHKPAGNCIIRYEFTLDILMPPSTDWFIWLTVYYGRCQRYPTATPMPEKY